MFLKFVQDFRLHIRQKYDFSGRLAVVEFNYNYYTVTVNYTPLQTIIFVLATLYKLVDSF